MRVIGIETSCDDTAVGIVRLERGRPVIETSVTASQVLVHRKYGGVVPEVAAREHALTILPTISAAVSRVFGGWRNIDAIAVTGGPGLSTALHVGVETARALAYAERKPVIRVNHIEGHIVSAWGAAPIPKTPALALVVSGGHTELIAMRAIGQYRLLGRTIDDAVGEAFDKTAKLLGLPYPGGPEISRLAESGDSGAFTFPRSLLGPTSLDFSYAGLKTSVLYETLRLRRMTATTRADLAASFQAAAIAPLVEKSRRALRRYPVSSFLLVGGVAANRALRTGLTDMIQKEFPRTTLHCAPPALCTDNGVMIAIAGAFRFAKQMTTPWARLTSDPNWELVDRVGAGERKSRPAS